MNAKQQRGVSLVEALVALAVMAFGMLGLVGMQATMRSNSDIAKQRSEAVRLAQTNVEERRTYASLAAFSASAVPATGIASGANATFDWRIEVPASQASPALRTLVSTVEWLDRLGVTQQVRVQTHIGGTPPELGAALGAPAAGGPMHQPLGRNPAIPPNAVDQGDGTSRFEPPTGSPESAGWVFNNTTGFIVKLCNAAYTECTSVNLLLLSGFARFSDSTPPDAEIPNGGGVIPVGVLVNQTLPSVATILCAVATPTAGYVAYYCPLPISTTTFTWSGQSLVYDGATPTQIAASAGDVAADHYRVCRYTPTAASGNAAHPAMYTDVNMPLANQNFLLIPAGNGTTVNTCPGDNTATPYVDGTTVLHQPVPAP